MGHIVRFRGPWCGVAELERNDLAAREVRAYDTSHTHRGLPAHETADRDDLLFSVLPDPESTGRFFRAADRLRATMEAARQNLAAMRAPTG